MRKLILALFLGILSVGAQAKTLSEVKKMTVYDHFELTAINKLCPSDLVSADNPDANIAYLECATRVSGIVEQVWIEKVIYPASMNSQRQPSSTFGRVLFGVIFILIVAVATVVFVVKQAQSKEKPSGYRDMIDGT